MSFTPEDPPTGTEFIEQTLSAPENAEESKLRPLSFDDFAGQDKTLERLKVMVGAARDREEPLNHILLSGPPGLGKTTLSLILALIPSHFFGSIFLCYFISSPIM